MRMTLSGLRSPLLLALGSHSRAHLEPRAAARRHLSGRLLDAHDGNILFHDGEYIWYAMGYTNCTLESSWMPPQYCPHLWAPFGGCGFRTDHRVGIYRSPDLVSWTSPAMLCRSSRARSASTSGQRSSLIRAAPSSCCGSTR